MSGKTAPEITNEITREFDGFLKKRSEVRRELAVKREFDKYLRKLDEIRRHSRRRQGLASLAARQRAS